MKIRKLTATALIAAVVFLCGVQSAAAESPEEILVTLDGEAVSMEQAPMIVEDRVVVQFRSIVEALGAVVEWEPSEKKITIIKDADNILLAIGSKNAAVNGVATELDVAPFIGPDGNTMVPLRFVSEAFGLNVSWQDNTVALESKLENTKAFFSKNDLIINIEGRDWELMEDADQLIAAMSGEVECFESISCAYDGMDRLYSNEDFSVSVLPISGKSSQIIDEILLTSSKYSTSKGIRVGSTAQEVINAYGPDYTDQSGTMTYWAGEKDGLKTPRLYFEIEDGKVTSLGIFGARNAG